MLKTLASYSFCNTFFCGVGDTVSSTWSLSIIKDLQLMTDLQLGQDYYSLYRYLAFGVQKWLFQLSDLSP